MKKENILIVDCNAQEVADFARTFKYNGEKFIVKSHIANWKRSGKFSEIKRYIKYFAVGIRYFFMRKRYGVIAGWQQFYTLIFCFICWLFHLKKSNIVIALNFTYKEKKGIVGKIYRAFMEKCITTGYLDYLHVPSQKYADAISEDFGLPKEKILVVTFGIPDEYEKYKAITTLDGYKTDGYALAIGRSNRDYEFLINAWQDIDYPLVIVSDTYKGISPKENIVIFKDIAGEASYPWMVNCGIMIIPIAEGNICSGDTVLLTAMSFARKIIVTKPSTLAEMYIQDGENGLLVPKEKKTFKCLVEKVLGMADYQTLGERARESFLKSFSRENMGTKITNCIINMSR